MRKKAMKVNVLAKLFCACIILSLFAGAGADAKSTTKTSTKTTTKYEIRYMDWKAKRSRSQTFTRTKSSQKTVYATTKKITKTTTARIKTTKTYKKGSRQVKVRIVTKTTTRTVTDYTDNAKEVLSGSSGRVGNVYSDNIDSLAKGADNRVLRLFKALNYELVIDDDAPYTGMIEQGRITLRQKRRDVFLHELGHFLDFYSRYPSTTRTFSRIYKKEKVEADVYCSRTAGEYYAQSFKDYTMSPGRMKKERPQTYQYIKKAVGSLTNSYIKKLQGIYGET